jgi:hypothetical protein
MEYIAELYKERFGLVVRVDTIDKLDEITEKTFDRKTTYLVIEKNSKPKKRWRIASYEEFEEWYEARARDHAWKSRVKQSNFEIIVEGPNGKTLYTTSYLNDLGIYSFTNFSKIIVKGSDQPNILFFNDLDIFDKWRKNYNATKEVLSMNIEREKMKMEPKWDPLEDLEHGGVDVKKDPNEEPLEKSPVKEINSAVDPKHYKEYFLNYQWIEAMQNIAPLNNFEGFNLALELQVRKYLDRQGKKDNGIQELLKARWYLDLLIARKITGHSVVVNEIESIIKDFKKV